MKVKLLSTHLVCDANAITKTPLRKKLPSLLSNSFKKMNRIASAFLVLMLVVAGTSSLNAQLDCSGNVPIETLANGMDYTIVSDGSGNVDISVTVVDNPVGLVGFLGGPGGIFGIADGTGTITYNLTGQTPGASYTLDMFFNWAAGGAGNSETVECAAPAAGLDCSGNVPIETLANGMDYTIVSDGSGNVDISVTVVDNPVGLVGFLGGPGGIFGIADGTGTITYNLTGQTPGASYTLDMFFNWAAGGAGNSETVECAAPNTLTAPITNAPNPTCLEADVVSIYGDYYGATIATNYDPNWGQSGHLLVDPAYDPGTGDAILAYPNFNYQGTELITTDLSAMAFLNFDVWTAADPASTFLQVSPINMGTGPAEVLVDVPYITGEWTRISLPIADFTGMTWDAVFQMKFAANGPGSTNPVDIYLDNVYFSTCAGDPLTAPNANAPEPICDAADVVSIYGDYYPTNIATNYDPNWGQSGHLLVDPAYDPGTGNVVLAYPNFNYQGTELVTTDLSAMDYLYIDVWTAADEASTTIQVSPINMGTGPAEFLVDVPYVSGEWTTVVLEKADFGGMTWDAVFQMKFAANGPGSTNPVDIYLDNVYFSSCAPPTGTAPITNAPEPTCDPQQVVSVYGDFYGGSIATNYDPNWGQSGHLLVDPAYDPGTGNVVLAYPNFNYQGTELITTDLSAMTHLNIDVWTAADPASTFLQVSPINAGTGPAEFLVDVPYTSGEWTTISLPITDFGGMTWDAVFQMKFAANAPGSTNPVDIYLDNIFFSTCGILPATAPTTNAPDPICDETDVVSIYGDFYPSNIATNYDPNWGQSGHLLVDPAYDPGTGNTVLAYPNFNYQGTELITTDLSDMEYLNFDVWTAADPANTFLQVSPINTGTGPAEFLVNVPYVSGEWTNIKLPIADFGGMTWDAVFQMKFAANGPGSTNPVDIYLDNIYFSGCKCEADDTAPELECASSDELLLNGSFADVTTPAAFPVPADFAAWNEFGDNYDDALTDRMTVKMFGFITGVAQDATIAEGDWLCMDAQAITLSGDDIVGTSIWGEVKIEFYDAGGAILNGPFGTVLGDFNQSTPAVADVWTNVGGCIQAPENAVTARAILIFLNFNGEGGAIIWDDASLRLVEPMQFCSTDVIIDNPVATDDCELESFENDFNNTEDASGTYPIGETVVTYTAIDHAGNQSVCSILVVVDDEDPTTNCPADMDIGNDAGLCGAIVNYDIEANDNCTFEVVQTEGLASGAEFPLGTTTNTFVVTDGVGNSVECSFTVTVEDTEAPMAMCQDVTLSLDENGEATIESASEFIIDAGSSDNCDGTDVELMVSQANFTCDNLIAGQASTDIVVTLIVTDAAGNMSMCTSTVTLMDDTPPSITCPANINIALDPGDCDRIVDYTVLAEDNCSLVPDAEGNVIIQTAGLPSGSVFERGTTTNTFEVTDPSGNVSTCSFDVFVQEFQDPITALVCNAELNISLDENCEAFIGADQILEGGPYGCYDDYIVEISGIAGQTISAPGTYTITITDPDTGNSCWSEVTVEDKLEPTLICTECPPGATMAIELPFVGTLDADSPIWTRPFGQIATCAPSGAGVDVPYQTHEFLVVTGADSDFENVSFTAPSADFFMVLYQDSFDPLNPCGNMVINNDDGGGGLLSQFDVMLESGTQYILVATTFNNNGNDFGDYIIELDSDAVLINAPLECLFTCFDEAAILSGVMPVPSPVAMDNCIANLPTTFTDVVTEGEICGSKVITRTFSIIANDGSVLTSCVAEYQLFAAQFTQFVTPPAAISLPCGTGTSPEDIEAFFDDPTTNDITSSSCPLVVIENNEGTTYGYLTYPTIGCDGNTHLQKVDNNQCGFFTTYSDQEIPSCGAACGSDNVKVIRTWTILDWCNSDVAPFTFIQVIESADNEAPTIEVASDFEVSVNPWNCLGDFSLPAPTLLHDLCSADITYTVSGPAGTTLLAPNTVSNPSANWIVFGAPKGIVSFTYTAADCCGNTSSAELLVNINDTTPPVPVATENIIINLTTNGQLDENGFAQGFAKLFTNSVDDGSYDGCSGVKIEIARTTDACDERGNTTFNADGHPGDGSPNPNASNYDPDNGEFVKFCCADINQVDAVTGVAFGLVEVRMRVFDDGNMTGFYGDFVDNNGDGDVLDGGEYDNYNETWVTVRVEGKAVSSIVCPPDVTIQCDMDYTDANIIGTATTLALCGSESVTTSFTPQLNACGVGFVIATYTVEGSSPTISCSQRITVQNDYEPFDPNGIRYPRNLPTSPTGQISCTDDITYDPPTWTAGACDFIGYTEEVDTFFIEAGTDGNNACFKILRRFTVIDWCVFDETNGQDGLYFGSQTIKITDNEAPVLSECEPVMFDVDGDCVRTSTELTNTAVDNGDCASDWLKWQVFVDTWADGVVDYEYSSFVATNTNFNTDSNDNDIVDKYLAPSTSGEQVSIVVTEVIESSMFNHLVTWKVTDGCGNVSSCTTTFMVVDKKAPTPYCVSLSTALMENGGVELWAIDFDLGAFDNCTDQENLRFTFDATEPVDGENNYDASLRSQSMEFNTAGLIPVNVYVWDEKGNVDFCTISLTVIDNNGTGLRVAGITATELGNGVSEADVLLEANLSEYPRIVSTNDSGAYAFESNPVGVDYEVTVNKNDNHTNGVSTLDLVLIQRHILAFADLDSPYKVIAADINRDDKVSSIDVIELRKLILGVQEEFSQNTSWRFVDATQTFAEINSPWPIDETRAISELSSNMDEENFVAVKVGDVNATAALNVSGVTTEIRSGSTMLLELEDRAVVAGEQVEISVSSADFNAVSGLQMTVEFNGLTFNDVSGKAIAVGASNVGVISDNVITMSWNTNTAVTTTDELFVITAVATQNGNISEMIKVTDRVITPEVYVGSSLETLNVELGIRGSNGLALANELMQNEPNPFKQSTAISFNLATAGKASLTIRDVAGKVIRTVNGEYAAGMNTISIEKSDINTVGVLYYTLISDDFSDTKKMIIVD